MRERKIAIIVLSILVTFLTPACSAPPAGGNETAANVPVENKSPSGTPAAGAAESQMPPPEELVSALYKAHDGKKSPFFQTKDRALVDKYFAKPFADLIWKDANSSSGEVGAIDADPLYNAQDTEIKNFAIGKGEVKGDTATVAVTFTNYDQKQTITFALKAVGDAWKIDNILYGNGDSLMKWLKDTYSTKPEASTGKFEGKYQVGPTTCTVKQVHETFEVRWAKGSGVEVYLPVDGNAFETTTDKGGLNRFKFDDAGFNSGTFSRDDGKTFPIKRAAR